GSPPHRLPRLTPSPRSVCAEMVLGGSSSRSKTFACRIPHGPVALLHPATSTATEPLTRPTWRSYWRTLVEPAEPKKHDGRDSPQPDVLWHTAVCVAASSCYRPPITLRERTSEKLA